MSIHYLLDAVSLYIHYVRVMNCIVLVYSCSTHLVYSSSFCLLELSVTETVC